MRDPRADADDADQHHAGILHTYRIKINDRNKLIDILPSESKQGVQ